MFMVCSQLTRWDFVRIMRFFLLTVCFALVTGFLPASAYAGHIQNIANGITVIDIDGDGQKENILKTWRENFNAHGFSILLITSQKNGKTEIVPFFENDKEFYTLKTNEGADCILTDYIIYNNQVDIYLIRAQRDLGNSYVDELPVIFTRFKIKENNTGEGGVPALSMAVDKKWTSKKSYCDVNEAIKAEIQ